MKKIITIGFLLCFCFANIEARQKGIVREAATYDIHNGLAWLKTQQLKNGSFSEMPFPAITALAVSAFLKAGYTEEDPVVQKAIEYIVSCAKEDGSIYEKALAGYNTAICLTALAYTNNPKYKDIIEKGRKFLIEIQIDEGEKVEKNDKYYGGAGYNNHEKPDLSNLSWSLEALKETEGDTREQNQAFEKALVFLQRCQNLKSSNDQDWAGDDGGFIYSPDPESKAGKTISYGSMTYAGLKSFIYCNVDKSDPRVQAAFKWISSNFTVDENPNLKADGLYYYYHTMAKALQVYGEDKITDSRGKIHNWKKELFDKLVKLQKKEGFWVNAESKRWLEDNKVLVTAYTILSLEWCLTDKK